MMNAKLKSEVRNMKFKVKELREELGLSQEELSQKAKVSRTIISGLESGTIEVTTTNTLLKLADALGKKVQDIILP
jgi:transcriptional regulator with XRE-family HTH domain